MRNYINVTTILGALLLTVGCGGQPELVDETQNNENVTTVQETTAQATQKDDSSTQTIVQDSNEKKMDSVEEQVKSIYFDYDKFLVKSEMREIIEQNGAILSNEKNKNFRVKLEGNCDEWGSDEYNYALGLKRAKKTKDALIAQGITEDRITIISFGEANPECSEKTQSCWAKNRRVDFKVLP